jgi:hypothetical protein
MKITDYVRRKTGPNQKIDRPCMVFIEDFGMVGGKFLSVISDVTEPMEGDPPVLEEFFGDTQEAANDAAQEFVRTQDWVWVS